MAVNIICTASCSTICCVLQHVLVLPTCGPTHLSMTVHLVPYSSYIPAGRSEEVMPSLPPILSCATDFTDVGEGKIQGRNLHNNDSIQQQFNKSSFIERISLSWHCRVECLNLKHFVCILVGKCHEWGNSPLVLPVEGLWVHTCSGAFLVNFHYHNEYYNDFKIL